MLDKRTGARLANLWDDAKAAGDERAGAAALPLEPARLRQAHHQLSAAATPRPRSWQKDPLTGENVEVLWVKGSGGDLGSIKLDGFATLYMDKLRRAEEALSRPRRTKTRWSATCRTAPSTSIRARPRSTRRCMPSCRSRMSTTCIPTRSSPSPPRRTREALTKEIFGDEHRLAALAAAGLRTRPVLEKFCARTSRGQGRRARQPRPVHLGRHAQGMLRDDARDHQPGDRLARARRPRASRSSAARRSRRSTPAERAAPSPRG